MDSLWTCRGSLGIRAAHFGNHWPRLLSCYFTVLHRTWTSWSLKRFLALKNDYELWIWGGNPERVVLLDECNKDSDTGHRFPDGFHLMPLELKSAVHTGSKDSDFSRVVVRKSFLKVPGHSLTVIHLVKKFAAPVIRKRSLRIQKGTTIDSVSSALNRLLWKNKVVLFCWSPPSFGFHISERRPATP
jgi:hypothetical protein